MGVKGLVTVRVQNAQVVAIAGMLACYTHYAVCCGQHRRAGSSSQVMPQMEVRSPTAHGVGAPAVTGGTGTGTAGQREQQREVWRVTFLTRVGGRLGFAAGLAGCFRRCGQSLGDGSGGFLCKFREVTLCAQEKILLRLHSLGKGAAQFRVKRQAHHPCGQRHQQHHSTKKHLPPQQGVSPVFTGWTRGRRFLAFALRCGIFPHGPHLLLPDCMQAGSQIEQQYKSSGSPCVRHKLSPPFYVLQIIRPGLCAAFPGAHPAASGAW